MSEQMKIGVAAVDISPSENFQYLTPTGMGRHCDTRGVLDPLRVEAMAIEIGGELLIVTTSDLRWIPPEWGQQLRKRISEKTSCDERRILLSSVHCHCSSPDVRRDDDECRAALEQANEKILAGFVSASQQAVANLAPAEIAVATTQLDKPVGQNRRMLMDNGTCLNGWGSGPMIAPGRSILGPAGSDSRRVDIFAARHVGQEKPFVVLTSYSAHPHLYQLPYFSGEFPGAAKREIESHLPGAIAMYANACGGDIDLHCIHPMPDGDENEVKWFREKADMLGRRFSKTVMAALPKDGYTNCESFKFTETTLDVAHINAVSLGDIAFATIPGELFISFAERVQAESPFANTILMSYNGSTTGYVPPAKVFEQGSYEVMRGPRSDDGGRRATETLGEEIIDTVIELLKQVK